MKKETPKRQQSNQFDKVFKENMELALPGVIERVLKLRIVHSEELPHDLQHTKERKPDTLKKVTDDRGSTFILHIEWQVKNEADMVYRTAEYRIMLLRKYRLPVKQYVLYIGQSNSTMAESIEEEDFKFMYHLISISKLDYKLFLQSKEPEEKMLAILANFGKEDEGKVIKNILQEVKAAAEGDFAESRYFNQLRVLVQLRNLHLKFNEVMESISTFFKEEKDPFYIKGEEMGEQKKNLEFVRNLLLQTDFPAAKIASLAGVTEEFVNKVKEELK